MEILDPAVLEDLPLPRSKAELLERIPPARQALESIVSGVSETLMLAPDESGWSIKDHLAHLATWERMIVAHLQAGNDNEIVGLNNDPYAIAGLDEINALIERQHKNQSLTGVLEEFHRSHAAIVEEIARLSDAGFARPYWDDEPDGRTVLEKVAGDTYRHYLEHRRWILDMLKRNSTGSGSEGYADALRIRRVRADEGLLLRSLRLRALADAPMAFGTTLAEEKSRPEGIWHERAADGAAGQDRVTFIVESGHTAVGLGTGVNSNEDPLYAALVGVWIDPVARGQNCGAALVEAVAAWAWFRGKHTLELWVTESNSRAIKVYERSGFCRTGETQPLPHTPSEHEIRMVRSLDGRR